MASHEWWVMRVVVPKGGVVTEQHALDVERGALCVVNDEVCEPIDVFEGATRGQERALAALVRLARKNPGEVYKTVLSTDDI